MAVIWDFKATTGMTAAAIQPVEKPADHMASVLRVAFDGVSCKCTNVPSVGDIMSTPDTRAIAAQLQNLDLSGVPDAYDDQDDESEGVEERKHTINQIARRRKNCLWS